MKILIVLCILAVSTMAFGADVTLQWDANTETTLSGYKIHHSLTSGGPYGMLADVKVVALVDSGNPSYNVFGITDDITHYFVLTAYLESGLESGYSIEANCGSPPETINIPTGPVAVCIQ